MKKRAMKKHIPYGEYCHGPFTVKDDCDDWGISCDVCPWWYTRIDSDGQDKYGCKYLGIEQYSYDMLWDQVKECGEHYEL